MFFKKKEEYVTEYGTGYLLKKSEAVEKKLDIGYLSERVIYFSKANAPKWDDMLELNIGPSYFNRRMPVTEDGEPIGYVKEEKRKIDIPKCFFKPIDDYINKPKKRGGSGSVKNIGTFKCDSIGYGVVPKKRGRPKGSKNKKKLKEVYED